MLTESQKNYVAMLLMGGPLPESELRIFLAKSGWDIGSIDAGVIYSQSSEYTSMAQRAMATAENTPTTPVTPEAVQPTPTSVTNIPVSTSEFGITKNDEKVLQDHLTNLGGLSAYNTQTSSPVSTISNETKTTTRPVINDITPVMTMQSQMQGVQDTRVSSSGSRGLSVVIWILSIILFLLIVGVIGYMYYMGSGPFENMKYIKA